MSISVTKKERVQAAIQQNIQLLTDAKNKAKEPNISSYTAGMLSLLASLMDKTENMSEAELENILAGRLPLFIQPRRYPSEIVREHREEVLKAVSFYNMANPRIFIEDEDDNILFVVDTTLKTKFFDIGGLSVELSELLGIDAYVLLSDEKVERLVSNEIPEEYRQRIHEAQPV